MARLFHRLAGLGALALIFVALLPSSARAVNITVDIGGTPTVFDVVFFQGPASFNDNAATIQAAPWWTDATLASDFATAYEDQLGPNFDFDLNGTSTDALLFAYQTSGSDVISATLRDDGVMNPAFAFPAANPFAFDTVHFAYIAAAAVPVPEIDGGALGPGAVILLALWLMLRRRAVGALRRVAVRSRG